MKELNLVFDFDNAPLITKQHGQKPRAIFNRTKRKWVGTMYPVPAYKQFKDRIAWEAKPQIMKQGWAMTSKVKLSVSCLVYWPAKKLKGDGNAPDVADNAVGGIFDALQKLAYDNDGWIREQYVKRVDTLFKKRIRILIRKMADVEQS